MTALVTNPSSRGTNWSALRERRERRGFYRALLLSLLLHIVMLMLLAAWLREVLLLQEREYIEPLEVVLTQAPAREEEAPPENPAKKEKPAYVDTSHLAEAARQPERATFESDRTTLAASEQQGRGDLEMPSVEGRDTDFLELADQTLGETEKTHQSAPAGASSDQMPKEELAQFSLPTAAAEPSPTKPLPAESGILPTEPHNQLAEPIVRRAEAAGPPPADVPKELVSPNTLPPTSARRGFQAERRVTRIEGGVTNRGPASVAALGTPLGRYKKALSDAVGSRWYFHVRNQISLLSIGTVVIRFQVLPDGRVTGVRVLRNSSNESFAAVSTRAILEADIPSIPPEVAEVLEGGRLEVDYTFTILGN